MSGLSGEILFEKFRIIECFKKDQHSAVYLAEHIYLGKKIILKCLNTKTLMDDSVISRFKREAKIMAKLDHPNIIKVLDFGMFDDYFYISSEYFEGNNLRVYVKEGKFTPNQVKTISRQLFLGLGYAHKHKIIHRDIKPENIFLNEKLELKIGDFGLALSMAENFVTGQQSVLGTPSYMSPEQIIGETLTECSDLFSAGIVLFELLSHKNPFMGKDIAESINNIVNMRNINFEKEIPEKYSEFIPLISKLLEKRKSDRYQSYSEVMEVLGEPVEEEEKKPVKMLYYAVPLIIISVIAVFFIMNDNSKSNKPITNKPVITDTTNTDVPAPSENNIVIDSTEPKPEIAAAGSQKPEEQITDSNQDPVITKGKLFVDARPWADIYLDEQKIDTTPIEDSLELETGEYNLRLIHPEYPEWSEKIAVTENNLLSIKVNFDTLVGFFDAKILPWGEVFIDGKSYGVTPLAKPVKLIPGPHKLEISNQSFGKISEIIAIEKSDTLVFKRVLKKLE